jgi:hypothetical protein
MSDDQRQRHPIRDQGDNPPEDGTRSDYAGTGGPTSGVAPGGAAVDRAEDRASSGGDAPVRDPLADVEHPTADE